MNILLVGPKENNSTDGVILKGIKYLLNRSFPNCNMEYQELFDDVEMTVTGVKFYYNLIVVCGTPWIWDSFQNSHKYKNIVRIFNQHPKAKRLFMGIGSCLTLHDQNSEICKRPEEVKAVRELFCNTTVIAREWTARNILDHAKVSHELMPCPAWFCYGDEIVTDEYRNHNILVFQDPAKSISGDYWQRNPEQLASFYNDILTWYDKHDPIVYIAKPEDRESAQNLGLPTPILLKTADETMDAMLRAKKVYSCRVHCGIPAKASGADTHVPFIDTRAYAYWTWHVTSGVQRDYWLSEYDKALKGIFEERRVGTESQQSYTHKLNSGFFEKYMSGYNGLDIGFAGYTQGCKPILSTAIGIDKDFPGYDGKTLPFQDNSQDYVYSSHCLEHIEDSLGAISEWFRVLRVGGHMVIIVPHQFLYEKRYSLPSQWNADHKAFYTPYKLLRDIELSLKPNTYRVRLLEDGDKGFNYDIPPDKHSGGQYEITLVIEKIKPPTWDLL